MNALQNATATAAIDHVNLDTIKTKLMHRASGEGWSAARANAVETEYRRFLTLMKLYPNDANAPLVDVDTFWHYHILDTAKYADDCTAAFGYFLHHYPYLGMDGADGEAERAAAGARTAVLYASTFGAPLTGPAPVEAAWCGAAVPTLAWCGASATKLASHGFAWCGAATSQKLAWCGAAATAPASQSLAWCGAAVGAPAKQSLAWCGAAVGTPAKQTLAWCGAAVTAPTRQSLAWCGAAVGAPAKQSLAWCGAATNERLQAGVKVALSVASSH